MKKVLLLVGLVLVILLIYEVNLQEIIIPESAIRLRVIPNSNSSRDIGMKEKVKKYLEDNIYNLTKDSQNIEDARLVIMGKIPLIEEDIADIFNFNEYPLKYRVNYGLNYFPEKRYKGITYNDGYYESLVITIGEGNGDNWWCVLFPNFCLTDMNEEREVRFYFKDLIEKYSKKKTEE